MMDQEGSQSSVGVDDDGKRRDFRYVAWLLREKLNALANGDHVEPPESELQNLLNMAVSRKIISVDPQMLNPFLWRTLPKELLILVFARLPMPDITRLRSLSKEWNRDMATVNSEINRACDESSPMMVAGLSDCDNFQKFLVTICTQRSQYSYSLHLGGPIPGNNRWGFMGARDGGLACFVSTWKPSKANPLCIAVVNLLTRVQHKLPPRQYVYSTPPEMMHIEVDSKTKCYKVVVVGKHVKGHSTVEMYDSGARQWTKATPPLGFIFGLAFEWELTGFMYNGIFISTSTTWSVYDFAKGQLKRCNEWGPSKGASMLAYAVQKDCMFVLHRKASKGEFLPVGGYRITKYRMQNNLKDWVQERSYLCPSFEALLERKCRWMTLKACEGYLMAFETFDYDDDYHCKHFWLLDLSTGEWSSLPNCFDEMELDYYISMTQASWNVVP